MKRSKAFRRFQEKQAKKRTINVIRNVWQHPEMLKDERMVGVYTSCHCQVCSCESCGNPRNSAWSKKDQLTLQEKKANIADKE